MIACVGGGSNAIGIFDAFIDDRDVRLIGVEAGGEAIRPGRHAARFAGGAAGVLQGTRTFVLQDANGNIELTHSVSAGLDYAAVGPEHAWLQETRPRRIRTTRPTPRRSTAFQELARLEGILPALESAHAIAHVLTRRARRSDRTPCCWSTSPAAATRTCNSVEQILEGGSRVVSRIERALHTTARRRKRTGLVTYVTAGDPDLTRSAEILKRLDQAGADVLEVGVPFSDPLADGPVIQRATERALAAGHDPRKGPGDAEDAAPARFRRRSSSLATPIRYSGWAWRRS